MGLRHPAPSLPHVLQRFSTKGVSRESVAVCCSVVQCAAVYCSVLQCVTVT